MESIIFQLIKRHYQDDFSDLHLKVNGPSYIRRNGQFMVLNQIDLEDGDFIDFYEEISGERIDEGDLTKSYDFSFSISDIRFRGAIYHDNDGYCLSLRKLDLISTDFKVLGIPDIVEAFINKPSGLVLITGPTGSGKSTTLAAIINYLNIHKKYHIITIEDPIEYLYESNNCLINQKEVGRDVESFDKAVLDCLREDPDVIVVGEIRDKASCEAALRAAETGHLVLATLHTKSSASTITRIIDLFDSASNATILNQLSNSLVGIVSQNLLENADPKCMRVLATEVLVNTPAIASNIRTNKITMITNMVEVGSIDGMHLMRHSVEKLYKEGKISLETRNKYNG